jgi:hypothetical protein
MKRLPLILAMTVFPLVALAAEPGPIDGASAGAQWVWCKSEAQGGAAAWTTQRAEVLIAGTSVSGRLYLGHKEYARFSGVVKPASTTTAVDGATTRVWEITATEMTEGAASVHQPLALTGVYTQHRSAERDAGASVGSYEVLALSKAGEDPATLIISRVQPASPLRFAAR